MTAPNCIKLKISKPIFFTLIYAILVTYLAYHHAMWRDEIQSWLIAKDTTSISDFFSVLKRENHPLIWYALLAPFVRLAKSPELLKIVNVLISVVNVYLCIQFFIKKNIDRILFIFGFYFLWQYGAVSRSYSLGILAILLFLINFKSQNYTKAAAFLIIASNVHILFNILAIAYITTWFSLYFIKSEQYLFKRLDELPLLSLGIVFLGVILSLLQTIPPHDTAHAQTFILSLDLNRILLVINKLGYILGREGLLYAASTCIIIFICIGLVGFLNFGSRFLITSLFGFSLFWYGAKNVVYGSAPWHSGMLLVTVMLFFFINDSIKNKIYTTLFTLILFTQAYFGVRAAYLDLKVPYSNASQMANFIKVNKLTDCIIVADPDFAAIPISGYLGGKPIYIVSQGRYQTFMRLDKPTSSSSEIITPKRLFTEAHKLGPKVIVCTNYPIENKISELYGFRPIALFDGAANSDENYVLYAQ